MHLPFSFVNLPHVGQFLYFFGWHIICMPPHTPSLTTLQSEIANICSVGMDHIYHLHQCDETYCPLSIVGCHLPYVRVELCLWYPHTTYIVFLHRGEGSSCVITPIFIFWHVAIAELAPKTKLTSLITRAMSAHHQSPTTRHILSCIPQYVSVPFKET